MRTSSGRWEISGRAICLVDSCLLCLRGPCSMGFARREAWCGPGYDLLEFEWQRMSSCRWASADGLAVPSPRGGGEDQDLLNEGMPGG